MALTTAPTWTAGQRLTATQLNQMSAAINASAPQIVALGSDTSITTVDGTSQTIMASLSLTAGAYLIRATLYVQNGATAGTDPVMYIAIPTGTFTMTGLAYYTNSGTASAASMSVITSVTAGTQAPVRLGGIGAGTLAANAMAAVDFNGVLITSTAVTLNYGTSRIGGSTYTAKAGSYLQSVQYA